MKTIITSIFLLSIFSGYSLADTTHFINIHFLYGSKPSKTYKSTEAKAFGGIHGGQVTIQIDTFSYGFEAVLPAHIFAHKRKFQSDFVKKTPSEIPFNDASSKTTTFIIPLSTCQYNKLIQILQEYNINTPYDYAFFGMRCAAAVQDILGQIGVVKMRTRFMTILTTFYPKRLRMRLFRYAKSKNFQVIKNNGRTSRRWEKD